MMAPTDAGLAAVGRRQMTTPLPVPQPTARLTGWRARAVWLVPVADILILILLAILIPRDPDATQFLVFIVQIAAFGFVGAIVIANQPANAVGWILWFFATLITVGLAGSDYGGVSVERLGGTLPGTVAIAWLSSWIWVPAIGLAVIFIPLLFPNGRLPSRRWRPILWYSIAAIAAASLSALRPGPLSNVSDIQNPVGIAAAAPLIDALAFPPAPEMLVMVPMAIASLIVRYRHGGATERQQLKWFASVAVVTAIGFGQPSDQLSFASLALLPVGVGIAILRYRLYDIDRVISRTISYGLITALLVIVFLVVNLALQSLLSFVTTGNSLAVAGSTLLAAALFTPVRRRVQQIVDRRFDRARYDGERTASAFSIRMRDATDLPKVTDDLDVTVRRAIAPRSLGIWLRENRQ